jgi:tRNA-splicing ligase RtcB
MRVPARIFANESLLEAMRGDKTIQQLRNVCYFPGIVKHACLMPDGHQGYGMPIGGVMALSVEEGGISPGSIGYDINCGVRLLSTKHDSEGLAENIRPLLDEMFRTVPAGVGKSNLKVGMSQLDAVLENGAEWAVDNGYGNKEDLERCEEFGCMSGGDASKVSEQAKKRGKDQLATLGSGNHFLEIQKVEKIFDDETAKAFGIERVGQVTVMIHCGSRGLGHQTCSDYLRRMEKAYRDLVKAMPDRELVYAPSDSKEARDYFAAMVAAANFAWCNRHIIAHYVRQAFEKVLGEHAGKIRTVYDVCHNIAKVENVDSDGGKVKAYVHRKGATRAFGPERPEIPDTYRNVGQPIIIPGSMGTASWVLAGTKEAQRESFASTAHGAGRTMSRHAATKKFRADSLVSDLKQKGIIVHGASKRGLAEEAPEAYKDVDEVVRVSHQAGIGRLVARLVPLAVMKG